MRKPVLLMILDGYAFRNSEAGNAAKAANSPTLDNLFQNCPTTTLEASGLAVGLPEGQMGNSEVGHTNIGAGRVVYQDFTRINEEIVRGAFFENKVLLEAIEYCKQNNKTLHLMGLLSDGGVHSHIDHLIALLHLCKIENFENVSIHCFLDGRDTPPKSGLGYLEQLQQKIDELGLGVISTIHGRYYAMDRDKRYDRVQKTYDCMVNGVCENSFADPLQYIKGQYDNGITDEFVIPAKSKNGKTVSEGDGVVFFNFRPDRAREITDALTQEDFDGFDVNPLSLFFVCFTQYDETFENLKIAYPVLEIHNTLGELLSKNGLKQLRIAETEKYAHVTFFLNAGREEPFAGEERILVPSPKVATYDLQPEMSAYKVTEEVIKAIESDKFDFICLNFANCDMVGHTGVFEAAVKAVEAVDNCVKQVLEKAEEKQWVTLVTADHGNCEQMVDQKGEPFTAHTTNLVPFTVVGKEGVTLRQGCKLSDIAPTILQLLQVLKPADMTGQSILGN